MMTETTEQEKLVASADAGDAAAEIRPERRSRFRRILRWVAIGSALVLALMTSAWFYLTSSTFLTSFAEPILSSMSGGEVSIGHASLEGLSRLTFEGVRIRIPDMEGKGGELVYLPEVRAEIDWKRLGAGQLATKRIVVAPGAVIRVSEDLETGVYNFAGLRFGQSDPETPDIIIPEIAILHATIESGEYSEGTYQRRGSIDIAGAMIPETESKANVDSKSHWYLVSLRELSPPHPATSESESESNEESTTDNAGSRLVKIDGRLDPGTGEASAIVHGISFGPKRAKLLPRRVREWWDAIQPSGTLDPVLIKSHADGRYSLEIPMDGIDWTIPVQSAQAIGSQPPEAETPTNPQRLRMTDVRGTVIVRDHGAEFAGLSGVVEGVRYALRGEFTSLGRSPGFDLTFEIRDFDLHRNLNNILAVLPQDIRLAIDDQMVHLDQQSGTINATVRIRRDDRPSTDLALETGAQTPAPEMRVEGQIEIHDAEGTYQSFPYTLAGLTGEVEFNNDEVRIVSLAGRTETGGRLWLAGNVSQLGPHPAVDLEMYATRIPIDDRLKIALGEKTATQIDRFLNRAAESTLRDVGLFMSAGDRAAAGRRILDLKRAEMKAAETVGEGTVQTEKSTPIPETLDAIRDEIKKLEARVKNIPVFEIGGRVNLTTSVRRDAGPDQPTKVTTRVKPSRRDEPVGLLYSKFPYPLWFTDGELEISWERISILKDLEFVGLSGARASVSGYIDRIREPEYHLVENLQINGGGPVPIDSYLVHALPDQSYSDTDQAPPPEGKLTTAGRIVAGLNVNGKVQVKGTVTHDPNRCKADYNFEVEFENGRTEPFQFLEDRSLLASDCNPDHAQSIDQIPSASTTSATSPNGEWQWPVEFPLHDLTGTLEVTRYGMTIESMDGFSKDGGLIQMRGSLDWSSERTEIDLEFQAENLRYDRAITDLVGGLTGPDASREMHSFDHRYRPGGIIDATVHWGRRAGESGDIFLAEISPKSASMNLAGSEIQFNRVKGGLVLSTDGMQFNNLSAVLGSPADPESDYGNITIDGSIGREEKSKSQFKAVVQNGRFDAPFLPAIVELLGSESVAKQFETLDASGRFDADFAQATAFADSDQAFYLEVRPGEVGFTWNGSRFETGDYTGDLTITPESVQFRKLSGDHGDGKFALHGTVGFANGLNAELDVGLSATRLDARARAILPKVVIQTIDALSLDIGETLEVRDAHLTYSDPTFSLDKLAADESARTKPAVQFVGIIRLKDATMEVPVSISQLNGDIALSVENNTADDWIDLDAAVNVDSMRAEGRLVENGIIRIIGGPTPGRLLIPRATGDCYHGSVTATGMVQLPIGDDPGYYETEIRMAGIDVNPFLADTKPRLEAGAESAESISANASPSAADKPRSESDVGKPGAGSAYFSIAGTIGDPKSKRGRGVINVVDGRLYEVPLAMWALQISSFAVPVATSFDHADIEFYVKGKNIVFERMQLESPMMKIEGSGRVGFPSGRIDLRFRTSSRLRAPLFSDIWEWFRDSLFSIHVTGTVDKPTSRLVPFG